MLASIGNYEAITGTVVCAGDLARVTSLLGIASSSVLAEANGQLIEPGTSADVEVNVSEGRVYLPQRPVISVTALTVGGEQISLDDVRVEKGSNRRPAYVERRDGAPFMGRAVVSYSHGFDPIPGQIVSMVVGSAASAMKHGADAPATQETAGPFSRSWREEALPDVGGNLNERQLSWVRRFFSVRTPGSVCIPKDAP